MNPVVITFVVLAVILLLVGYIGVRSLYTYVSTSVKTSVVDSLQIKKVSDTGSQGSTSTGTDTDDAHSDETCWGENVLILQPERKCCDGLLKLGVICRTTDAPYILVSYPYDGAVLTVGETITILWDSIGFDADALTLYLEKIDEGTYTEAILASDLPDAGNYHWKVGEAKVLTETGSPFIGPGSYTISAMSLPGANTSGTRVMGGMIGRITIIADDGI